MSYSSAGVPPNTAKLPRQKRKMTRSTRTTLLVFLPAPHGVPDIYLPSLCQTKTDLSRQSRHPKTDLLRIARTPEDLQSICEACATRTCGRERRVWEGLCLYTSRGTRLECLGVPSNLLAFLSTSLEVQRLYFDRLK